MKKGFLLSSISFCATIGLSLSNSSKKFSGNWFYVNDGVNKVFGTNVTKLSGDLGDCQYDGGGFDCVVTFANNQLTANLNHTNTVSGVGQAAMSTVYLRVIIK